MRLLLIYKNAISNCIWLTQHKAHSLERERNIWPEDIFIGWQDKLMERTNERTPLNILPGESIASQLLK